MSTGIAILIIFTIIFIIFPLLYYIFGNPCYENSSHNGTGIETSQTARGKLCRCNNTSFYPSFFGGCSRCKTGTSTEGNGGYDGAYCKCQSNSQFYNQLNQQCETCPTGTHVNVTPFATNITNACTCDDTDKYWSVSLNKCI